MLDIKWIRENPEILDKALLSRGKEPLAEKLLKLDRKLRGVISEIQNLQQEKNKNAKAIPQASPQDKASLIEAGGKLREQLAVKEADKAELQERFKQAMLEIPNVPSSDVIEGKDENDNVQIRAWGTLPTFDFEPQEHHILGKNLGLLDSERAVKISGSRFALLTGALAHLERAVAQFMLDTHTQESGYTEIYVPQLVKEEVMYGTAQLPKFREDQFQTIDNFWLIPTAEVALTNLVREEILSESVLPIRVTAYTQCFRSEAGSAGRDMQGIFRLRQFSKVELVSIVSPDQEDAEHERMTQCAEKILQKLGLPYRVMLLCTGDMGFSSRKTYDLEVWLPGQNRYREISSCSKCGTFQAHRMNARYYDKDKKAQFVCTLNGSGLAVGRTVLAIMENYQQKDGSIVVPEVLRPYMGNISVIQKEKSLFGDFS